MTGFRLVARAFALFTLTLAGASLAQTPRPRVLISATPMAGAPDGAEAYRIRYRSQLSPGSPRDVTGVVVIPRGPAPRDGRDIIAWAHGTSGVDESCAPSKMPNMFATIPGLDAMLARGHIVVATDYIGLGTAGPHPYLIGDATAFSMLDSVRAARELRPRLASRRYAVWGESQGGHAALWTGKVAASYAPELILAGVAAAAPPTDLRANLTGGTNPMIRALLTAYAGASWSKLYDIPLSTILRKPAANVLTRLARNCVSMDPLALRTKIGLFRLSHALSRVDLGSSPRWAAQLDRNSLTPEGLSMPVLIAQGSADPVVAPTVTRDFARSLCWRDRTRLTFLDMRGVDHFTIGRQSATATINWIDDLFAGRSPPSDCRRI